jgi:hypothetical protein
MHIAHRIGVTATLQQKSHLCIPFLRIVRPQSQFPRYVSVSDLYIPTINRTILLQEICGPILDINRSQTHEFGNWD